MVQINENIRFYTANDPYHYVVDNLPLQDLLNNDKALAEAINDLISGNNTAPVGRHNWTELQPYLARATIGPNDFQAVFVRPGRMMARINSPAECHVGTYEDIPGLSSVDAINNLNSQKRSRELSGAGRTAVVEFRSRTGGGDQYAIIEPWSEQDWQSNPGSIARIDLVYVRAYPAVDQNGNSVATAPDIGILKGAGIIKGSTNKANQNDRFKNALNTKGHMAADATDDNLFGITAGESESSVTSQGSFPTPEDILNNAEVQINNAEAQGNRNYMFLPIAYVVVPSTYQNTSQSINTTYLYDVRPFFRTAELTFDERQAIIFTNPPASLNNPFATVEYVKDAIDNIELPPGKPGKPGEPGKPGQRDIELLGQGVIRGGIDYGPEAFFPSVRAMYEGWDGKPDWDILPHKYAWKVGNTAIQNRVTGADVGGAYVWQADGFLRSKKTIALSLPRPEYSHYFVDVEYMMSAPLQELTDPNSAQGKAAQLPGIDFGQGITVYYDTNRFTIVTTSKSWRGPGVAATNTGFVHGAYGILLGQDHLPLSYQTNPNPSNTGGFGSADTTFNKYLYTRYNTNVGAGIDGFVHLLPSVRYTVYAVRKGFLTTGGTLVQTIEGNS